MAAQPKTADIRMDLPEPPRRIVVLTGAGMSAESGIATFRDALTGLWARFDPAELACEDGFRNDPARVWGWYRWRAAQLLGCTPNAGHLGIAALQATHALTVITQNVDDLHERAGSHGVIHLHGELLHSRCIGCGATRDPDPIIQNLPVIPGDGRLETPPACDACGEPFRPGVVWFGEALPDAAWQAAVDALQACDLLVVIGTSGLVQPAASLPVLAKRLGVRVIDINPQPTPISDIADAHWPMGAGEGVAKLQAMLAMR